MLHLRQAVCLDVSEPFMAPQSIQNEVLYMGISFSGLKSRFFAFLDQIIHHHLPDIEITIDPKFEPRVERPPKPPSPANLSDQIPSNVLSEWESTLVTETKKCGEVLQRHRCRPVCHKYGNDD